MTTRSAPAPSSSPLPRSPAGLAAALLAFYDAHRRDLPWRRQPSAYRTLVSELMLQQTGVATVVPYFERFLARFPDPRALAAAEEDEVLALWSGLGYYARARNLQRVARAVVERPDGELPASEAELLALPGIGPYTAAAIAAIAFGVPTLALDGNVARVLARLFAVRAPIDRPAVRAELRAQGQRLVPRARPGDFAQALMELGALVCTPIRPRCSACPLRPWCAGSAAGLADQLPVRLPRRPKRLVRLVCAAAVRGGRVLLVQRPPGTLLAGTWCLPAEEEAAEAEEGAEASSGAGAEGALPRALAAVGLSLAGRPRELGSIRHVFTHRDVTAVVYQVAARGRAAPSARWVPWAVVGPPGLGISSFTRKTLDLLAAAARPASASPGGQRRARISVPSTR